MGAAVGKKIGLTGLTFKEMKKYPAIVPMYVMGIGANGLAFFYLGRMALKHPELSWKPGSYQEPWQEYSNKQYKFLAVGRDYCEGTPAPKYK